MARKDIPANAPPSVIQPSFTKLGDKNYLITSQNALAAYQAIAVRDTYRNFESNISVRDQFGRGNYEYFRPNEAMPTKPEDIISVCREAYRKVGLIRNVIDLMGDFSAQGVKLTHPNASINKFYRGWWKKINGARLAERFFNLFYREGIAIVKRTTGKISNKEVDRLVAIAAAQDNGQKLPAYDEPLESDTDLDPTLSIKKKTIPIRYNFLNPLSLKVVGDELAQLIGKDIYTLKVNQKLRSYINNPANQIIQDLVDMLPKDFVDAVKSGANEIMLDPRKVRAFHYKKDDWAPFGDPIIFSVLNDVMLLEKMKLADLAALDGAISQVRLWKLGDLEKGLIPTPAAIQRLADILLSNPGGGAFDLIWGPELSVEEYKTNVHLFLGKAKYEPVLEGIYSGLGIPPTLTGSANASGFTNNFISLKTLVQRLEYGRAVFREFIETELELVRQSMGFTTAAKVEFDRMVLTDEAAEKALLIQLVDRDYLSVETLVERFGECAEFEELKLKKERRARESGKLPEKLGPYPVQYNELMKIALQKGYVNPEQAGLDIPIDVLDSETPFQVQMKNMQMKGGGGGIPSSSPTGKSGQGRPLNSKDTTQRSPKTVKPVGANTEDFVTHMVWAKEVALPAISNIIVPAYLNQLKKANLRALSTEQSKQLENIKFTILCSLSPFQDINEQIVYNLMSNELCLSIDAKKLYESFYSQSTINNKREPTFDEIRMIYACVYSLICEG